MLTFNDFLICVAAIVTVSILCYVIFRIIDFVPRFIQSVVSSVKNKSLIYDDTLESKILELKKNDF